MTKYQLRDEYFLSFMHLDRYSFSIILNTNVTLLFIDFHSE